MIFGKRYLFEGVEVCQYPFEHMGISQGYNMRPSHMGRLAIDETGRGLGRCRAGAPFTLEITWKKKSGSQTGITFTNLYPVLCADGRVHEPRTLQVLFWHDNDTSDIFVGRIITQGVPFYDEGTADNATGDHVHLMVGKFTLEPNEYPLEFIPMYGTYGIKNAVLPHTIFFINDVVVRNDRGYSWTKFDKLQPMMPISSLTKVI